MVQSLRAIALKGGYAHQEVVKIPPATWKPCLAAGRRTAFRTSRSQHARQEGGDMTTEQAKQMAECFASITKRLSKPNLDIATIRDICEGLHVCGTEPEGVTYAE